MRSLSKNVIAHPSHLDAGGKEGAMDRSKGMENEVGKCGADVARGRKGS